MTEIPEPRVKHFDDPLLEKLASLGYSLPEVPAPLAAYVNCVRTGNLLHLSGGLPFRGDQLIKGKVPSQISIEEAQEAARLCILNRLAVIVAEVGSLTKIKQVVALNGFVNAEPDFEAHPQVINGASKLLVDLLGDKGRHSRTALGAASLPLHCAVEINLIVEVEA